MNIFEQLRKTKHHNDNDFEKSWSQDDLANELNAAFPKYKTNTSKISRLEIGNKRATLEDIVVYAKFFGVSADYICGLTDVKTPQASVKAICNYTGLTDTSVDVLANASQQHRTVINAVISNNECLSSLTSALNNYFSGWFKQIKVDGLGTHKEMSEDDKKDVFEYISGKYMNKFFYNLLADTVVSDFFTNKFKLKLEKVQAKNLERIKALETAVTLADKALKGLSGKLSEGSEE